MSRYGPHDDHAADQQPDPFQDEQPSSSAKDSSGPDPDELPWVVAPTSVPPDTTATESLFLGDPAALRGVDDATLVLETLGAARPDLADPVAGASELPTVPLAPPGSAGAPARAGTTRESTAGESTASSAAAGDPAPQRGRRRRTAARSARAMASAIGIARVPRMARTGVVESTAGQTEATTASPAAKGAPNPAGVAHHGGNGSVIGVFAILGVLIAGGITAMYIMPKENTPAAAQPAPSAPRPSGRSPSASPSPSPVPSSASPSPSVPPSPVPPSRSVPPASPQPKPTVTGDVTTARAGDCFVDHGTPSAPNMQKVVCTGGVLKVLRRIDNTADMAICRTVAGTTNTFFFQINGEERNSFVLCLSQT